MAFYLFSTTFIWKLLLLTIHDLYLYTWIFLIGTWFATLMIAPDYPYICQLLCSRISSMNQAVRFRWLFDVSIEYLDHQIASDLPIRGFVTSLLDAAFCDDQDVSLHILRLRFKGAVSGHESRLININGLLQQPSYISLSFPNHNIPIPDV